MLDKNEGKQQQQQQEDGKDYYQQKKITCLRIFYTHLARRIWQCVYCIVRAHAYVLVHVQYMYSYSVGIDIYP